MKLRICLASLIIFLCLGACDKPLNWHGTDVTGIMPDLEFSLVNEEGETVDALSFQGKTTLLYFGFTNCPGICPTTLRQISFAIDELGPEAAQVQVLLASVDPQRDTPEALKKYTQSFGPWLHGLTGDEQRLRALNNSFKVDYLAATADEDGNYEVMHSNVVFAFDAEGHCRLLIRDTVNTQAQVSDLRQLID